MTTPESWLQALQRPETQQFFSLNFSRLGLNAECHTLTARQIHEAMSLSNEEAPRILLYLACPSLQQAGKELVQHGSLQQPEDITLSLPYSDVRRAASMILQYSGAGEGQVQNGTTGTNFAADELDGYALLQQWAMQDRNRSTLNTQNDTFSATRLLQQQWTSPLSLEATNSTASGDSTGLNQADADYVVELLCRRLCDAAENM